MNIDYGISTVGGSDTGFAKDYLREIQKRTDDTYVYVSGSAQELAKKFAAGEIDLIPCVTGSELDVWSRMAGESGFSGELALSSFSLMTKFAAVYVRGSSDVAFQDLSTLKSKRIGYLTEDEAKYFPSGNFITPELRSAEFVAYNTEQQMRSDFESGKLDAVAKDCFRTWTDEMIVYQMSTEECFFMADAENSAILRDIDAAVAGISMTNSAFSSGLYNKYVAKYGAQR